MSLEERGIETKELGQRNHATSWFWGIFELDYEEDYASDGHLMPRPGARSIWRSHALVSSMYGADDTVMERTCILRVICQPSRFQTAMR